ncbi:MAG: hypothetical protein R2730_13965 [Chitinophagales bacterium]
MNALVTYGLTGQTSNNTGIFTGLAAGSYTGTVTDANGCSASVGVTISQPQVLTCSATQDSPVECNGEANGTATVTPAGGNGNYTFLWDNQETAATATS